MSILRRSMCLTAAAVCAAAIGRIAPAAAIVGGAPETGPVSRQMVKVGICGGVLLAQDVVLTAAHCAQGRVLWRAVSGEQGFMLTEQVLVSPRFDPSISGFGALPIDLALLKLKVEIPPPFEPARLSGAVPRAGEVVLMAGFGEAVQGASETIGILRSAALDVVEPFGRNTLGVWLARDGTSVGACKGDSGGVVVSGSSVLAVVSSIVGPCGQLTRAVLVGPQRDWIDATLSGWGRTTLWD